MVAAQLSDVVRKRSLVFQYPNFLSRFLVVEYSCCHLQEQGVLAL